MFAQLKNMKTLDLHAREGFALIGLFVASSLLELTVVIEPGHVRTALGHIRHFTHLRKLCLYASLEGIRRLLTLWMVP